MSNYSPILATGGGLLFNGSRIRIFGRWNSESGKVLWQTRLVGV